MSVEDWNFKNIFVLRYMSRLTVLKIYTYQKSTGYTIFYIFTDKYMPIKLNFN